MRLLLALLFLVAHALAQPNWPEIKWSELVPKGWDPAAPFKGLDLAKLSDADPRASEALEKLKREWDAAPVEPTLRGRRGKIPGFAIPLEREGEKVREFLLVPYFGACIHTPPPPANQIILARAAKPLADVRMMAPLWVYGELDIIRRETQWGTAGYAMRVERVEAYREAIGPR